MNNKECGDDIEDREGMVELVEIEYETGERE
jgi:hypothetical protein